MSPWHPNFPLDNTWKLTVSTICCEREGIPYLPVVMTTPARTFRRAWGEVKLSVSSLNLSTTRRETASARTWNYTHTHAHAHTHTHTHMRTATQRRACVRYVSLQSASDVILPWGTMYLSQRSHSAPNKSQSVETATSETRLTPWGIPNRLSSNAVWVWRDSSNLPLSADSESQKAKAKQINLSNRCEQSVCSTFHEGSKNSILSSGGTWSELHTSFCSWTATSSRWLFIHR